MSPRSEFRGESLVFILSQHRSGSTLLQQVLGGHSQILTDAESFVMLHPLYALKTTGFRAEYQEWEARV
ncbi:MAG: sulfotransferase, partial [Acidimicrobiales bacterium]|nr:sulfotransferase [Acidimicrobiales bacterium]